MDISKHLMPDGSLGAMDLRLFNKVLLVKGLWRLMNERVNAWEKGD